ncbi:ABC transporter permease [Citricoccus muralis]|uniref:Putative ABC transport system permease protein n=1 Tax=Citricoccus muralis TaxID=169134 RepID=A0A3D9LIF7_9MICC|nr:ABC transporter permease [Citricoccus muralis]REE05237.1 putative ABC transport system permease protein [Citricoccus muralis]
MRNVDVVRTALGNTMRSKTRTFLTVIAIVIGAFTLTLTSGLGAGINKYVDSMVAGFGQTNQIYVMPGMDASQQMPTNGEPQEYDPEEAGATGEFGMQMLTEDDIATIEGINGVTDVEPIVFVTADYLETADGDQFVLQSLGFPSDAAGMEMEAGTTPDPQAMELTVPETWLSAFGTEDPNEVLGETVTIGLKDLAQQEQAVEAEIVGVSQQAISGVGGSPMPSSALNQELNDVQTSGLDVEQPKNYVQAVATVENIDANETAIKQALSDEGLMGLTLEDQLGVLTGIIDTVTWVLNGFALIALLAASFGIVNTLLMSVQERTREIGLMKALGMGRGKVFGLFSTEAVMLGVMGSVIGVGLGVLLGVIGNAALVNGPLSGVAGLSLFAVDPLSIVLIVALILVIAFLAGTMPAARAAKKDPIEALRYE